MGLCGLSGLNDDLLGYVEKERIALAPDGAGADRLSWSRRPSAWDSAGPQDCDLADRCYRQSKKPALLPSGGRFAGPKHDDFRADWRAVIEIDDVLVRQADAAGRDVGANGPGFIGAVDTV